MRAQPALHRRLNLGATLRNLWDFVNLSGSAGRRLVAVSIVLTAGAAIVDAASLALLRYTLGAGGTSSGDLGLKAAAAFLLAALAGSALRLAAQNRTVAAQFEVGRALALRAFVTLQRQSYADYLRGGASEGFAVFERLIAVAYFGINPMIAGAVALLSAVVILCGIALLYPLAAALMALVLPALALETALRGRKRETAGLSSLSRQRSLLLYEARAGFRHILLANGEARMCEDFARTETRYRAEQARAMFASQSSRYTVEIAGLLIALGVLAFYAWRPAPGVRLVPLLAVIALATFRLLPQIATLRSALQQITLHADVTDDIRNLVTGPEPRSAAPPTEPVRLTRAIALDQISLSRADRPTTLDRLDLEIPRGARVGIMGESGIGKSSLLDIVCGAIAPDGGAVRIDDTRLGPDNAAAWRERIGMVSQEPMLLGATLREAVLFPQRPEQADPERFAQAVAAAGVDTMVAGFPLGLDTPVGETSSLLSGGQRQRLALAHALYRAHDLLLLDEATGQLDAETEAQIVATVAALPRNLTIVIASHRRAAFAGCDAIYRLERGKLVRAD
ncbi:MAG: ATP-binding cassette domain-containing protein [Novosphingobium sp.]